MTDVPKKKTAVVCDDHGTLLTILKHLLSKKGFVVLTACDGLEGLEHLREGRHDLLLLDLNMPSKDGLGVLEELVKKDQRPYTIVLSGQESEEKRSRAEALGAQEIWKKPFSGAELIGRIDDLVSQGRI